MLLLLTSIGTTFGFTYGVFYNFPYNLVLKTLFVILYCFIYIIISYDGTEDLIFIIPGVLFIGYFVIMLSDDAKARREGRDSIL